MKLFRAEDDNNFKPRCHLLKVENIVEVDAAGAALDSSWLPVVVPVLLLPGVSQQPGHKLPPGQRGLTGSWMEELPGGWRLPDYQATRLPD